MENIRKLLDSGAGQEMKDYLESKLAELKSIDSINEKDVGTHQVIEVKAQKRAYVKLAEILSVIMTLSEPIKSKDSRDRYDA